MFLNPIKTSEENDLTYLSNNDKEGMKKVVAKCLTCLDEWDVGSKGGANVCHKCGATWWEKGKRNIIFKHVPRNKGE